MATQTEFGVKVASLRSLLAESPIADPNLLLNLGLKPLVGGWNNQLFLWETNAADYCIKVFRNDKRERAEREWLALNLLAKVGLDFAPRPIWSQLESQPAAIIMEFVPGCPLLNEKAVTATHLAALTELLQKLYSIPYTVAYPYSVDGSPPVLISQIKTGYYQLQSQTNPMAQKIAQILKSWLASKDKAILAQPMPVVFSHGDPNLANLLWDRTRLRCLDFEYAGWSDRAFDLADVVEHIHSRRVPDLDWSNFIASFELKGAEKERFEAATRMFAVFWLMLLWQRRQNELALLEAQFQRASSLLF